MTEKIDEVASPEAMGTVRRWMLVVRGLLDLVVLGLGIQVILGAVQRGKES